MKYRKLLSASLAACMVCVCLVGCNENHENSEETPVQSAIETPAETPIETPDEITPAPAVEETIYSTLTDDQFLMLTDAMANTFYSFAISEDAYQQLAADPLVLDCLGQILSYAYDHCFELNPDYKNAFSTRYDLVSSHACYETLKQNFAIDVYRNSTTGTWEYIINSYSISPEDLLIHNEDLYLDAEGYLNKGVVLYWEENGSIVMVGEVVDIAYNAEIAGTVYGYAVNVEFYDDPSSSGWMDGEMLLAFNKRLTGKPIYYIDPLDENRCIKKEEIDYSNSFIWKPLHKNNAKEGTDVFLGSELTNSKSYLFTIVNIDEANDTMIVSYPSGSIENKSYSSMLSKNNLYIR